ncbi:hypothetical protein ONS96_005754 [Cadophora gregata f. sp. sojae]|nr:hypothetical protein ONS96_005754 [Cadophora gregata f. sp. sojae]
MMGEERPSLRTIYAQGEYKVFLEKLLPTSPESEFDDFRKGLGASNEQIELLLELVNLAFKNAHLSNYDSLEDPEAKSRLKDAVAEPVLWLDQNLPEVPTWFTNKWCTHIMELMWRRKDAELADERAKVRNEKLLETVDSVETPESGAAPFSKSYKAPPALPDAMIRVKVFSDRRDKDLEMVFGLPIKKFLLPGKSPDEFSSYSYDIFVRDFEKAINQDLGCSLPRITILQGTLGYLNQDERFMSFYGQQSFESALMFLFGIPGNDNILCFIYRRETEDARNARLKVAQKYSENASVPATGSTSRSNLSNVSINGASLGRGTKVRSRKRTSPPPSPAPRRPLPPLPGPERERGSRRRQLAKSLDAVAPIQPTKAGEEASSIITTAKGLNKPLPPIPIDKLQTPDKAQSFEPATSRAKSGSKIPIRGASIPHKTTTGTNDQTAATSTSGIAARKPFLVKGASLSSGKHLPAKVTTRIAQPANTQSPAPLAQHTKRASDAGNRMNPNVSNLPFGSEVVPRIDPTPISKNGGIRRGGTRKFGTNTPFNNDSSDNRRRTKTSRPHPFLRSVEAKKTPNVVNPQDGPSRISSQRAERERWETSTNPEDHTRRSLVKRKQPNMIEAVMTAAKRRVSFMLSPKSPTSPNLSDVQEIIDQSPAPGDPLTPPPNQPDQETGRVSTSTALSRITSTIRDKEVVVNPAKKKTLGLLKVSKPRLASKADRFGAQDKRYPHLYTEIARHSYRKGGDEFVDTRAEPTDAKDIEEIRGLGEVDGNETGDEDDSKTPADYMVEQFQKMQNMPELTQMHDHGDGIDPHGRSPWEACCELFQIDPTKTSIDERVSVTGLKTPIYQYQAFGVYWQMRNSRDIGGGFVADEMGLGKTLSFLAYIVVERQLAFLWEQVEKSRAQKSGTDGTHLQPGEAGLDAVCPSMGFYGKGWIACPCASPVTSALAAKPGVRLAIVPPSLVPTWVEQWDTHVDIVNTLLQMSLVIAHDGSNPTTLDGKMDNRDGRHPAVMRRVQANRINFTQRARNTDVHFFPDQAQVGQERILVVTTRDHYNKTWATKFEYKTQIMPEDKNGVEDLYKGKSPGVVYGIAMIDECHEDWQKNKGRSAIAASLPKYGRPFVWGYSGTPLNATPRSIEGILWAIESLWPKRDRSDKTRTGLEQEQDSDLWRYCWKTLNNICVEFESEVKKGSGNQIIFQDFYLRYKPFLTLLMIRRTTDTTWFGHPLIRLMPHVHQDIILAHNTQYDEKIEQFRWLINAEIEEKLGAMRKEWRSGNPTTTAKMPVKFSFNSETRLRYKERLFATFPYLSVLGAISHPDHLDLTVEELKKFRGVDEKRNPYYKHLKNITETSAKMMWLYNFINELDKTEDVNGEEQKVVIISEFNQVAFILKLWIERHLKGKNGRVGIIYAGQRPRDRKAAIEAFTDAKDHKKERKQKANYQFLVGTTRIIGAGLQLTRSCNVVIMEPDYEFHRELQGYARVHRIGQKNPESRSYRLIDALDPIEQSILKRQTARGEFPGRLEEADERDVEPVNEMEELLNLFPDVPQYDTVEERKNTYSYSADTYDEEGRTSIY